MKVLAGSIAALALVLPVRCAERADAGSALGIVKGPYLQRLTKHSVTIMWETSFAGNSIVEYGTTAGEYGGRAVSDKTVAIHEVDVAGLDPETTYHYRVVSETLVDGEKVTVRDGASFRTAVNDRTPFSFAVYGDSRAEGGYGGNTSGHQLIASAVALAEPSFVMHTGDIVMGREGYREYAYEFFEPAKELLKHVPFFVAIGDHERRFDFDPVKRAREIHWYYDFISAPEPETYYSFDFGNSHFVVLDPTIAKDAGPGIVPGSAQHAWLADDLGSSKATWKLVFLHYPPYPSARRFAARAAEMRQWVCPVLEGFGVDVVFSGHAHHYERSRRLKGNVVVENDGTIYVVTGGGGCGLTTVDDKPGFWAAKVLRIKHFCFVEIDGTSLAMQVVGIDGEVADSLRLSK